MNRGSASAKAGAGHSIAMHTTPASCSAPQQMRRFRFSRCRTACQVPKRRKSSPGTRRTGKPAIAVDMVIRAPDVGCPRLPPAPPCGARPSRCGKRRTAKTDKKIPSQAVSVAEISPPCKQAHSVQPPPCPPSRRAFGLDRSAPLRSFRPDRLPVRSVTLFTCDAGQTILTYQVILIQNVPSRHSPLKGAHP